MVCQCKQLQKNFNVPRNTLKRRVLNKNQHAKETNKVLGHYRPVFNAEQEQHLVEYLLEMEVRFFGITLNDLRSLAYKLAEQNNITHNFNHETKLAGKDWVRGFRQRHPEMVLRVPEATSAARAQAFNKVNVTKFFDILEDVQKNHLYPPHRVFNVDETGLMTVQTKSSKVFALKGRRQVGSLTSAERGVLSTFVVSMSAGGTFIPPMVIFPRQRMKVELQDGSPPGTVFACHPSGWMQTDIFTQWFEHFLRFAKPSKDDPVLLVLDGHATHTRNLDFIEKARKNHTTVVCIPPHCSHKLQPLDVAFMGPFNTYYVQAIERFLRNNPGRQVTQYQVSRLLGESFLSAATPTVAVKGFRRCGIVPINRDVFTDADFVASTTTEIPNPSQSHPTADINPVSPDPDKDGPADADPNASATSGPVDPDPNASATSGPVDPDPNASATSGPVDPDPNASTTSGPILGSGDPTTLFVLVSSSPNTSSNERPLKPNASSALSSMPSRPTSSALSPTAIPSTSFVVSPQEIIPIPKTNIIKRQNKRKKGSAAVLTSSPYKAELEAAKAEKENKERLKKIKLEKKEEKKKLANKKKKPVKEKRKPKVAKRALFLNESDSDESDADCLYCQNLFSKSKSNEGWIRCSGLPQMGT
ncbi:MFS-type transporter clz9-like [Homalodisca vitripennis]|uniref:MFS-type transporter clz9-like n=1 Tax=Homalodisca vitripennis TaxID=197043 RepID=UPI001EEC2044|nr:MFS-type transporter clz9-like [Homalodisca vitripennis]